ncbi:cellulase family protein [Gymnopus androsaceus JB14]|uniref:Cellulase family protein n=1 Tax=Gymnopus androsaceus JB14 TaxID=1447944 RepID=A0A6A4IC25_9AGAR|nr:cellulase family protein [Gymnopus androsaceus JB14]
MWFSLLLLAILGVVLPALAQTLPLQTESRWILDATGARVKLRCINWAGHLETNIPEGLHVQTIDYIADFIQAQGFNCVRLTYSIDYALNPTISVQDSFTAAANASGLPLETLDGLYSQVVATNPFVADATVQDVRSAVIAALWDRQVMTILDNHVSKASWCCSLDDGNGWWDTAPIFVAENSQYFNTTEWLEGLTAIATWAQSQTGVVAMSIRNELRPFPLLQDTDNHDAWYEYVTQGAQAVNVANPDVLIIIGGSQSAEDLSFIKSRPLDITWTGKHVFEMHAYSFSVSYVNPLNICSVALAEYGLLDGFVLTQNEAYTAPLILSEFGVGLSGGPNDGISDADLSYFNCIMQYMEGNDMEWALWALQGSYYIRQGVADVKETWGLIDYDWVGLRNEQFLPMMANLFLVTQGP